MDTSRPGASADSPCSAPRQRQLKLRAAAFSLYQPRPMGRGETRRALHRLVTIGSLCLLGELPATPLAPSLLAPHPMSCAAELALRLLRRRGLCGRTNKRTTCRSFETAGVKHGHPVSVDERRYARETRATRTRIPYSVVMPRRSVILEVCFSGFQKACTRK